MPERLWLWEQEIQNGDSNIQAKGEACQLIEEENRETGKAVLKTLTLWQVDLITRVTGVRLTPVIKCVYRAGVPDYIPLCQRDN